MWTAVAFTIGLVGWRIFRSLKEAPSDEFGTRPASTTDEQLLQLDRPLPAYSDFEICWAYVPYDTDPSKGKVRPVLVLDTDEEGITVLELRSERGPTTEAMTWVRVSENSARTFDRKHQSGWIKVAHPRVLPITNMSGLTRPHGHLTEEDAQSLRAAMLEYVL